MRPESLPAQGPRAPRKRTAKVLLHMKWHWTLGSSLVTSASPTFDTVSLSPKQVCLLAIPSQDRMLEHLWWGAALSKPQVLMQL